MYEQKLSVIIPTKNRRQYALRCIATILDYEAENIEVVVQDNSDNRLLEEMLGDRIDGKYLRYAYTSECLSFCDNFERAVELSTGDYLITIGDDDCVFPKIGDLADALREKGIDSAVFATETSYIWPNAVSKAGGKLVVRKQPNIVKVRKTADAIDEMKKVGNFDYQRYAFPKIYHGIVSRAKMDAVKAKTGHYFGGLTPDIYSAVALSFEVDRIVYIGTPFTLPGTCAKSGSADSLTGRHTGELKDAPHFRGHTDYEWNKEIPAVYSVDTIWAETAFRAVTESGGDIHMNDKELFAFLTHIAKRCPMFGERLSDFYAEKTGADRAETLKKLRGSAKKLARRAYLSKCFAFGVQVLRGRIRYQDVKDIDMAVKLSLRNIKGHEKAIKKVKKLSL